MNKLSEQHRSEIVALYQSGTSSTVLGDRYGVSCQAVLALLRRRKVAIQSRSEAARRHVLNDDAFASITPESAYWIGFLMADGCITGTHELRLNLATRDGEQVERFRAFLRSSHTIGRSHGQVRLAIKSRKLCSDLAVYGIVPRKSTVAQVVGLEGNRDFWRGVVDGDGNIYYSAPLGFWYLRLVGSRRMMEQFLAFAKRLTPTTASVRPHKSIAIVCLGGVHAAAILYALYHDAPVALRRKEQIASELFC